jgi:hypothetical protein
LDAKRDPTNSDLFGIMAQTPLGRLRHNTGFVCNEFNEISGLKVGPLLDAISHLTWQTNGSQYLVAVSGIGGTYARQPDPNPAHVPKGGVVTVFKQLPQ